MYSRIEERDNAEAYIHVVNQKARDIPFEPIHSLLELA
jgi:hypothetical protein